MIKSCEKRPVSREKIENASDIIEKNIQNSMKKEVYSKDVGEMVMEELKKLDEVSYVRFASVYREFKDLQTFVDELEKIINKNESI